MHIVLALAGAIITILIIIRRLDEAGLTLSSFNPFAWYRKHKWLKQYHTKPLYTLSEPEKVAALMIVAVAKADGLISIEEKNAILELFEKEFNHSKEEASGLFTSSAFFLKDETHISPNIANILELSVSKFTENQVSYTIECMQKIAALSSENSVEKNKIITGFTQYFNKVHTKSKFDNR